MAFIIVVDVFVGEVVGVILIDGIVGEMHVEIGLVYLVGMFVFAGGQSGQSLIEDEDLEGDQTLHKHINPEIELIVVDEAWRTDVLLHDGILFVEGIDIFGEVYASPLGAGGRLHNVPVLLFVLAA